MGHFKKNYKKFKKNFSVEKFYKSRFRVKKAQIFKKIIFSKIFEIFHHFYLNAFCLFVGKNYIKRIKENIRIIKKLPKINGVKEILYPGQGINSRYKRNLKKGIVIPKNILEGIKKLNVIK